MASNAVKKLVQNNPAFKRGAEIARQEIFGHVPQLNVRSGSKIGKKQFTGTYLAKYYPESINKYARMVSLEDELRLNRDLLVKKNCETYGSFDCCYRCMRIGRQRKKSIEESN